MEKKLVESSLLSDKEGFAPGPGAAVQSGPESELWGRGGMSKMWTGLNVAVWDTWG